MFVRKNPTPKPDQVGRSKVDGALHVSSGPPRHDDDFRRDLDSIAQQARVHVARYDRESFLDPKTIPLGVSEILAYSTRMLESTHRREHDDDLIALDLIKRAEGRIALEETVIKKLLDEEAQTDKEIAELRSEMKAEKQILGISPASGTTKKRRWRRAAIWTTAALVDFPLAFLSLQILGSDLVSTIVMAAVLGGIAVIGAHLLGKVMRWAQLEQGGRSATRYLLAGIIAAVLVALAIAFAVLRMDYVTLIDKGLSGIEIPPPLVLAMFFGASIVFWTWVVFESYRDDDKADQLEVLSEKLSANYAEQAATRERRHLAEVDLGLASRDRQMKHKMWDHYRAERKTLVQEITAVYLGEIASQLQDPEATSLIENLDLLGETEPSKGSGASFMKIVTPDPKGA